MLVNFALGLWSGSASIAGGGGGGGVPSIPGAPSWVSNATLNTWIEMPNTMATAVSSQMPTSPVDFYKSGPTSRYDDWCGAALKTSNLAVSIIVHGGGHNDYAGNEILELKLNTETPSWTTLLANTPHTGIPINVRRCNDNSVSVSHTYTNPYCVTKNNRDEYILVATMSTWGDGNGGCNNVERFSLTANSWFPTSECPEITAGGGSIQLPQGFMRCQHPITQDIYFPTNGFGYAHKINVFNYVTTRLGTINFPVTDAGIYRSVGINPTADIMVSINTSSTVGWQMCHLSNGFYQAATISGNVLPTSKGSMAWDPVSQCHLYVTQNSSIVGTVGNAIEAYQIYSSNVVGSAWLCTRLNFSGNVVNAETAAGGVNGAQGMFSRTLWIEQWKGFVCFPRGTANGYFVRMYA